MSSSDSSWKIWENQKFVDEISSICGADKVKIEEISEQLAIAKWKDDIGVGKGVLAGITGNPPDYSTIVNIANRIISVLVTNQPRCLTVDAIGNHPKKFGFIPNDRDELCIYLEVLTKLNLIKKRDNCYYCTTP
ncbi:hypothetical protein [Planktothrix agardhii]|jgi:hypothetical protein|uniref:hypothetical protein n=1 Tax=Planktothrix agardhii TaxID=1160 RepID=UPI0028AB731E|nr:hypothetical protein [Planktothrix agardhii]